MKRVINSWPYVLGVVAMYVLAWGMQYAISACESDPACAPRDTAMTTAIMVTAFYLWLPAIAFAGATVLGFRRGYDWVTILVCLAIGVLIPGPHDSLAFDEDRWATIWLLLFMYGITVHIGVAAGIGLRALARRRRGPKTAPLGTCPDANGRGGVD